MRNVIHHSIIRYVLVGILNTLCGVGLILVFLHVLNWGYWSSTLLGNGMAMILSYHLNARWTFKTKKRNINGFIVFLGVSVIVYGIAYLIPLFFWGLIFTNVPSVKTISALSGSFLYTVFSYLVHRIITFRVFKNNH